jgi:chemotaxis protein MotB
MQNNSEKTICSQYESSISTAYQELITGMDSGTDSDDSWLISMTDLLSLLLVFFIMFLVMTKGSGVVEQARPAESTHPVLPVAKIVPIKDIIGAGTMNQITSELNSLGLGEDVSVQLSDKEIIFSIKEKVTFSPGEAQLLSSFEPVLDNIAGIIEKNPSFRVDIIGHTDNIPIHTARFPSNWELSVARAASVLKYFINIHALEPSRLSIKGNADQKPIVPNDTPDNRSQNRRVEIRLTQTG